jgi:hypothetical protein
MFDSGGDGVEVGLGYDHDGKRCSIACPDNLCIQPVWTLGGVRSVRTSSHDHAGDGCGVHRSGAPLHVWWLVLRAS